MSIDFHSKVDEAKKELEEAQKAYNEIDKEYVTYKNTHERPLDTDNPEVRRIQKKRNEAEITLEEAIEKLNKLHS